MPLRKYQGYLVDVISSIETIQGFTHSMSFDDYLKDERTRLAVERKLSILGEALVQAKKHFPRIEQDITDLRQIIAFRNRLIHTYLHVDDKTVWGIIVGHLDLLKREAETVLKHLSKEDV